MKLTFDTLQECLTAFNVIDAEINKNGHKKICVIFKNIRSFKKWNITPLSSLNILTGPNSSGKSTLAQIISNLRKSKFKKYLQFNGEKIIASSFIGISMDWKEYKKGSFDPYFYRSSVHWRHLWDITEKFDREENRVQSGTIKEPKRLTIIGESQGSEFGISLYAFVDQELVGFFTVETYDDDELYFRISKKFWEKLFKPDFCEEINQEIASTPEYFKSKDPHKLNKEIIGDQKIDSPGYFMDINSFKFNFDDGPNIYFGDNIKSLDEITYSLICLSILFFKPFNYVEQCSGDVLPSIRPISTPIELQYKFQFGERSKDLGDQFSGVLEEVSSDTADSFKKLAVEITNEKLKRFDWNCGTQNLKEVIYWLKEILNESYKLAYRYNEIVLKEKKHPFVNQRKVNIKIVKNIFIEFFLVDKNKNQLDFKDVGTGISQVLPVISSIINSDHLVFLQPELHLHPKAQAILGDLFIYAIKKQIDRNKRHSGIPTHQVTVETHSEHLILRLLRRIKENDNQELNTFFSNKNLSLIYINPQKEGSEIYWIRVDRYGEFVDVWPNGFFEDRYEDLFFIKK